MVSQNPFMAYKLFLLSILISTTNGIGNIIVQNHKDIEPWWIAFYLFDVDLSCGSTITNVEITDNNLYSGKWVSFDANTYTTYDHCAFLHQQAVFTAPLTIRITKNNPTQIIIANDTITSFTADQQYDFGSNFMSCPTISPTKNPSNSNPPTTVPSKFPTVSPTTNPTQMPTIPSKLPTLTPSQFPTIFPTETQTHFPTETPSKLPTLTPSKFPTETPTYFPTETHTYFPTYSPTHTPTNNPITFPSYTPTIMSENVTNAPSKSAHSGKVYDKLTTINPIDLNLSKRSEKWNILWIYVCISMTVLFVAIIGCIFYYFKLNKKKRRKQIVLEMEVKNISTDSDEHTDNSVELNPINNPSHVVINTITPGFDDKLEYTLQNENVTNGMETVMEGNTKTLENALDEGNSDAEYEDLYNGESKDNDDCETPMGTCTDDGNQTIQ